MAYQNCGLKGKIINYPVVKYYCMGILTCAPLHDETNKLNLCHPTGHPYSLAVCSICSFFECHVKTLIRSVNCSCCSESCFHQNVQVAMCIHGKLRSVCESAKSDQNGRSMGSQGSNISIGEKLRL